jgi:diacylglycerol kinase family enzyme
MRHRIIVNPKASRGAAAEAVPLVRQKLSEAGLSFDLVETRNARHATSLACDAAREGIDVVVAMGGDGILNEVLNGLMQARDEGCAKTALGLIPVGRGNDFAYGAGIPEADIAAACEVLAAGRRKRIDIGRVAGGDFPAGLHFANGVGIGFDAVVGFEALVASHDIFQ